MSEANDRGDDLEIEATGDKSGDTDDLNKDNAALGEEGKKELGLDKDKEADKKEPTIPKGRFDEAVGKARKETEAANRRADELEQQLKAQQGQVDLDKIETQLDEAEDKLEKAIADGNAELKAALRREIRQLNRQVSDAGAAAHAARATAVAVEQIRYGALVTQMEAERPELNPDNEDDYDEEMVAEITEYKEAFEAKGFSSSEALKKALKAVPAKAKEKAKEPEADKDDEDTEDEKAEKAKVAKDKADKLKADAIQKALDAKKKQPADTKKTGLDSDKAGQKTTAKPVSKMSDKEFDALSEEERKRARGDIV